MTRNKTKLPKPTAQTTAPTIDRVIRMPELCARWSVKAQTIYSWMRNGSLEHSIRLAPGSRLTGWLESVIIAFEQKRRPR